LSRRDVFTAIADPTRRALLETLLQHGSLNAGELADSVPTVSRPGVSRHLRVLRECGVVSITREGRMQRYTIQPGPILEARDGWMAQFAKQQTQSLARLRQRVERGQ
jgi:DNA-binding transcriptional ArsR family regulator